MVKSQILEAAHIPRSLASIFGQSSPDLAKEKQASDVNFSEFNAIVNPSATWMMLQVPNGLQPATQLPQTQSQAQILKTANTKKKSPSGGGKPGCTISCFNSYAERTLSGRAFSPHRRVNSVSSTSLLKVLGAGVESPSPETEWKVS